VNFPIGQVFRVPPSNRSEAMGSKFPNLREVTRGRHARGIDIQKGIFFYEVVRGPDKLPRRPAFVFDSNNIERRAEANPWLDIIDDDGGYALYHGDNRQPGRDPLAARGNRQFVEILNQFSDPNSRDSAPPILLFEHIDVHGKTKGHRRFAGFGVPTGVRLQAQASRTGHFINLAIELALLGLEREKGLFSWDWIDDRRDRTLQTPHVNRRAPQSWKEWLRHGDEAVARVRRSLVQARVHRLSQQRDYSAAEVEILHRVQKFYKSHPHTFEGLASWVTQRLLGHRCLRGWVTQLSADGGFDFVNRLDVGEGFSSVSLVVLGEAKLRDPETGAADGRDLARVVARLRRGWIGSFVTTGAISEMAQREVLADGYPLTLINGKRLAQELLAELARTGDQLDHVLEREKAWHEANISTLRPEYILGSGRSGHAIWPPGVTLG
jgi:hypothetical protein